MLQTLYITLLCKVVLELLPLHANLSHSSTEQPEQEKDAFIMIDRRPEGKEEGQHSSIINCTCSK